MLGLGNSLSKGGMTGPTIVTDALVLKHKYDAGAVVPVSDGAAYFDGVDDYIDLGSLGNTGDDVSVSAWIYISAAVPLSLSVLTFGKVLLHIPNATTVRFYADVTGSYSDTTLLTMVLIQLILMEF